MSKQLTDDFLKWTLVINGNPAQKALGELEQTTRKLEKTNKDLRVELQKMESQGKKDTKAYKQLQTQIKSNNQTISTNKKRMGDLRKEIGLNSLTARQLRSEYKKLKNQIDNTTPNTPQWKALDRQMKAVKGRMAQVNSGMKRSNSLFGTLKGLLPALGIGIVVAKLAQFGKELFNLSKTLEQFDRKAKIVFGESLPKITEAAAENARQMGLTRKEYVHAAANAADLLVPLGFNREMAAGLSMDLTNLSGALDEWSGGMLGTAEVNRILTKTLLGEAEQIKQLGIVIDQSSKEYNNRIKVLMETQGATKEQARALDILNQIQTKSVDAQTAYNQEANTLLRWQKKISTGWRQMKENVVGWFEVPVSEKLIKQRANLNLLVNSISSVNDNEEIRLSLIQDLQKSYPDFLANLDAEKVTNEELRNRLREVNDEYDKRITYQVLQEEILENEKKAQEVKRQQRNLIKDTNAQYEKHIKNRKEGLSWQEQSNALQKEELQILQSDVRSYEDVFDAEKRIRFGAETAINTFNKLQQRKIELQEEYNSLLSEQNELGIKTGGGTITPTPTGGGPEGDEEKESKELERQKTFREKMILESKKLIAQEVAAYKERLKNAGLFYKDLNELSTQEKKAREIIDKQHKDNIDKITDQAYSDNILKQQKNFDLETTRRQTAHNNQLAQLAGNQKAQEDLKKKFKEDEINRQIEFLNALLAEYKQALNAGDIEGLSLEDALLSDEAKESLQQKIEEVNLILSELGIKVAKIRGDSGEGDEGDTGGGPPDLGEAGGVDIFGMTAQGWAELIYNIEQGNFGLEETIAIVGVLQNVWGEYNKIKANIDRAELQRYELNAKKRKDVLNKQLDQGLISQEEYNARVASIESEIDDKKREASIRAAKREKATALVGAIINTAAGIAKMLGTNLFPLNFILAALVGAMGAVQITKIASESIPQAQKGLYDVIGQDDGKRYRARKIKNAQTGLITEPTILAGEQPEIIIDPATTRNLQVNYPEVIEGIDMARVNQFATGNYSRIEKETYTEKSIPPEFYDLMEEMNEELKRSNDIREKGIPARLVADSDYVDAHNEVIDDYNALQKEVNIE